MHIVMLYTTRLRTTGENGYHIAELENVHTAISRLRVKYFGTCFNQLHEFKILPIRPHNDKIN